jgi:hypothetical protein
MFRKQFEKEIEFESDKLCHSKDFDKDYKLSGCHVSRKCIFFVSWVFEHFKKGSFMNIMMSKKGQKDEL